MALVKAGDIAGIVRKLAGRVRGRPIRLPSWLKPRVRPMGSAPARPARERPLIWMVGPSFAGDGAPASQFELAHGLASRDFDISVFAAKDGPLRQAYMPDRVDAQLLPQLSCSPAAPAHYEADVRTLAAIMRAAAPDLIIASTVDAFPAIDAARLAGIPTLWNIRESEPWRTRLADRHTAVAARAIACFAYPGAVVFVAESSKTAWSRFTPKTRARVIYNAPHPNLQRPAASRIADLRAVAGASADHVLLVSVGTLCERKGQVDLAEALARLRPEILSRLRVAFVGRPESDYEDRVHAALTPATAPRVSFIGQSPEAPAWIAAADGLINTSRSEAFPRTFLEAAVMGTPIIASAVDGATERLANGRSALLYRAGDPDMLASSISRLVSSSGLARQIAAAADEDLVRSWTWANMIDAYAQAVAESTASATI